MLRAVVLAIALLAGASKASAVEPPPIEAYGKLPAVENVVLSPDGQRLAFVAVAGDARKLAITDLAGKPITVAAVGTAKVRSLEWAGSDRVIVWVTSTLNLGMDFNVSHIEALSGLVINLAAGGKTFWLFESGKSPGVVFGDYGVRRVGDKWYGYYSTMETAYDLPSLYRIDLDTGGKREIAERGERRREWLVGVDGQVIAHSEFDPRSGDWRLISKLGERKEILSRKGDIMGNLNLVGLGRKPTTAMVWDRNDTEELIHEIDLTGAAEPVRMAAGKDVRGFIQDEAGLLIGFRTHDEPGYMFFDPALQSRYRASKKAFPEVEADLTSRTPDLGKMIFNTSGGTDSGTFWLVDIAKSSADPIGYEYTGVRQQHVGPTRMVPYKAADGLAMDGVLTLPPAVQAKNLPLVVLPHGGPIVYGDRADFDWWAQAFASRGYAVFQPNYRGTLGYGLAFRDAADGEWGRKMQTDITDGVAELVRQGVVDPKRACIVGGSYGGYAALAGVTLQQGFYRCAVAVAGVSDLRRMLRDSADRSGGAVNDTQRFWKSLMGVQSSGDALLNALSPAELADRADAPVLLIHGKDDTVVAMEQSKVMEAALRRAGKPVELITLKGEDHWLSREETRIAMLQAAVAFVEKHNPTGAAQTAAAP